jgi:aspartate racemase
MRHLGILAHSAEGAALCLRTFCQLGSAQLGPHLHPDVTLDCIAFGTCMPAWDARDYAAVRGTLAVSLRRLAAAGADFFACPDNTAHLALEYPGAPLALPGLHIAEVLAGQASRDGRAAVGILGTRYTMDSDLYPRALGRRGIAGVVPDEGDRQIVNDIIFGELVEGNFTGQSRSAFAAIIARLGERRCDAVALACTEIPLLIDSRSSPLPVLDSTRLLAAAALEVALGHRALPSWRGGEIRADGDRAGRG